MTELHFHHLFDGERWHEDVRVSVDPAGTITNTAAGTSAEGCEHHRVALPGVPNLHSHAHQRAMAGLAERSGDGADNFWTWREAMYRVALRLEPDDLEAVAAQLYVEMLEAGYTAVGEFQYLHHDRDGRPYAQVAEMSLRTAAAARETGIGITHLPVLYAHGDFGGAPAHGGQRRFLNDAERFLRIVESMGDHARGDGNASLGIAPHSLRAVSPALLDEVLAGWRQRGPVHIHVAEQVPEVEGCVTWSGQRPVAWLLDHADVDDRWCLIHATHMDQDEISRLARSGATVGLCPTTEANLGDGLFPAPAYQAAGGRWGIGSDSQVSASPTAELRMLEYGQRLAQRARNVLAGAPHTSTGRRLLQTALEGGARACGRPIGRIAPGCRADLVTLDLDHPRLFGRTGDELVDSWIFSGDRSCVDRVMVGGRWLVEGGRHIRRTPIAARFARTMTRLAS